MHASTFSDSILSSPDSRHDSVWSSFQSVPQNKEETSQKESTSIKKFVASSIAKQFASYVENGGFALQYPVPPIVSGASLSSERFAVLDIREKKKAPVSPAFADAQDLSRSQEEQEKQVEIPHIAALIEEPALPILNLAEIVTQNDISKLAKMRIDLDANGGLSFEPTILEFPTVGAEVFVDIAESLKGKVQLYPRDPSFLKFDRSDSILESLQAGSSEMIVIFDEKVSIVDVEIENKKPRELSVPKEMTSVQNIPTLTKKPRHIAARATNSYSVVNSYGEGDTLVPEEKSFEIENDNIDYGSVTLQIVDERSGGMGSKIYPVRGAQVLISGTQFQGRTDARGLIEIRDLPKGGNILVQIRDEDGVIQPSSFRVQTNGDAEPVRHMVLRRSTFDTLTVMSGVSQLAFKGSMCGNLIDEDGQPMEGVRIELEAPSEGPYFFNRFGMIDSKFRTTADNGRFCFFNVEDGPSALHFYRGEEFLFTKAIGMQSGFHIENDFYYSPVASNQLVELAVAGSAHQHIRETHNPLSSLKRTDWVNLQALASDEELTYVEDGVLQLPDTAPSENGFFQVITAASDFEDVVYQITDQKDSSHVLTLLPRGYIEDLAFYAERSLNMALGQVIVDFGLSDSLEGENLVFEIFDASGRRVDEGWVFHESVQAKAIFFNVPPGEYALIIRTREGFWLDSRVIQAYSTTTTYISSGAKLASPAPQRG